MKSFLFSASIVTWLFAAINGYVLPRDEPGSAKFYRAEISNELALRSSNKPLPAIPIFPDELNLPLIVAALTIAFRNGLPFTGGQNVANVQPTQVTSNMETEITNAVNQGQSFNSPIVLRNVPTGAGSPGMLATVRLSLGQVGNVAGAPSSWEVAAQLAQDGAGTGNPQDGISALVESINDAIADALTNNRAAGSYDIGVQRSISDLVVTTQLLTVVISWSPFDPII